MIIKGYYPFSLVEEVEFKKLLSRAVCPSRKTISSSLVPKLYNTTKEKLFQEVSQATAICITTDGWTSINNQSFIAVTAHWINTNYELCSNLLDCIPYDDRHTAVNLSNFLKGVFSNWKIENKVVCVISDNAANITAAIRMGGWRHLGCFAHSLNLTVQGALKEILVVTDKWLEIKHNVSVYRWKYISSIIKHAIGLYIKNC
ncbi:hypothetical protein NQ315_008751 [Exocentrus adspersus]|uniref:DUF659 domain-containing protein n=1 Tax=Exocentrus adspersus TaxID=1586481 RepID=A0AAV8VHK8_9CUCU|nr:hypothetical protein NQ315_008751 [Exocentrus adspersus]